MPVVVLCIFFHRRCTAEDLLGVADILLCAGQALTNMLLTVVYGLASFDICGKRNAYHLMNHAVVLIGGCFDNSSCTGDKTCHAKKHKNLIISVDFYMNFMCAFEFLLQSLCNRIEVMFRPKPLFVILTN